MIVAWRGEAKPKATIVDCRCKGKMIVCAAPRCRFTTYQDGRQVRLETNILRVLQITRN